MLSYFGGKVKLGKKIAEALEPFASAQRCKSTCKSTCRRSCAFYWEPFLGMGGTFLQMCKRLPSHVIMIGSDADQGVMCFWNAILSGWLPPPAKTITRIEFLQLQTTQSLRTPMHIFVGYSTGFQNKYFSRNWRPDCPVDDERFYKNLAAARKRILRQLPLLHSRVLGNRLLLLQGDYRTVYQGVIPHHRVDHVDMKGLIYADPPYAEIPTVGHLTRSFLDFDSKAFWQDMRVWSSKSNLTVLVSEYTAPSDFVAIQTWPRQNNLFGRKPGVLPSTTLKSEKLYLYNIKYKEKIDKKICPRNEVNTSLPTSN